MTTRLRAPASAPGAYDVSQLRAAMSAAATTTKRHKLRAAPTDLAPERPPAYEMLASAKTLETRQREHAPEARARAKEIYVDPAIVPVWMATTFVIESFTRTLAERNLPGTRMETALALPSFAGSVEVAAALPHVPPGVRVSSNVRSRVHWDVSIKRPDGGTTTTSLLVPALQAAGITDSLRTGIVHSVRTQRQLAALLNYMYASFEGEQQRELAAFTTPDMRRVVELAPEPYADIDEAEANESL